ncbi:8-amino-7-oxononanoate synthase [Phaeovibrio sulfidiphilus]|uniref:8-amino-7-oxononanoate synthase n=1 Tax=Phaeovibrio sulfidiphilus TaxID=1220600 RepID=A0A8J6YNU8_9PROT|nr:8-amino-7-oxononanoate synthase [Phaeovibrio sulfidiphilus]MBE1236806.1 8-amino-7-oxononanoate synthase [Phaeovibrio sulfidiphilus]
MTFELARRLETLRSQGLYRHRLTLETPQTVNITVRGRSLLAFCSNDYLGLAARPEIADAFMDGLRRWGTGGGASHLVNGHFTPHHELETALARFTGRPRALLFGSGYAANVAVLSVFGGMATSVLQDRLNHASLLDGGLLSGTRMVRYLHNDPGSLETHLGRAGDAPLVVTDGVFSMDGDLARLPEIAALTRAHGGLLVVDDAHGFGVLGERGTGSVGHLGLDSDDVPVLVGTLGKSFGTSGAFVAGSEEVIETLIQFAHSYIYTTSTPPALACATLKALELLETADTERAHLSALISTFRTEAAGMGLGLMDSQTPIQPVLLGDNDRAVAASAFLEDQGLLVRAIRPPTVPRGTARLRITFSAAHTHDDLARLLCALKAAKDRGIL